MKTLFRNVSIIGGLLLLMAMVACGSAAGPAPAGQTAAQPASAPAPAGQAALNRPLLRQNPPREPNPRPNAPSPSTPSRSPLLPRPNPSPPPSPRPRLDP